MPCCVFAANSSAAASGLGGLYPRRESDLLEQRRLSAPMHSYCYYRRDSVAGMLGIRAVMEFLGTSSPGRSVRCFVKRDRNRGSAPARMAQGSDPAATP